MQNGLGYADARAKSNRIFFNAWLNGQTNGYSYGELVDVANCAIWQYRDMYLRPDYNPDVEYIKDPLARNIPSVDNSLFILARKLILESK